MYVMQNASSGFPAPLVVHEAECGRAFQTCTVTNGPSFLLGLARQGGDLVSLLSVADAIF